MRFFKLLAVAGGIMAAASLGGCVSDNLNTALSNAGTAIENGLATGINKVVNNPSTLPCAAAVVATLVGLVATTAGAGASFIGTNGQTITAAGQVCNFKVTS